MALAVAQRDPSSGLQEQTGGVTSDTLDLTSVSAASLLIVTGSFWDDTQTEPTVSDDVNGSWTIAKFESETGDGGNSFIAYYENSSSGSPTITVDWGSTTVWSNICALEVTGAETSSALDQTGSYVDNAGGDDDITVSTDGALASGNQISFAAANSSAESITWGDHTPSGYTEIGNNPTWDTVACQHVYDMLSGGSVETLDWVDSNANYAAAVIATFKEASAGPITGIITFSTDLDADIINKGILESVISFPINSTFTTSNEATLEDSISFPIDTAIILTNEASRQGIVSFPIEAAITGTAPDQPPGVWTPTTRLATAIYKYILTR